jgi:hypothetical protein
MMSSIVARTARADLALQRGLRNRLRASSVKRSLTFFTEQALVGAYTSAAVNRTSAALSVAGADDREAADELRIRPLDRLWLDLLMTRPTPSHLSHFGLEAHGLAARRGAIVVESDNAPPDEEDVGRIDLKRTPVRVLAAALRQDVRDQPFRIFSSACWTPSPDTSRVDRFSSLRQILSTSSIDDALLGLFRCRHRRPAGA